MSLSRSCLLPLSAHQSIGIFCYSGQAEADRLLPRRTDEAGKGSHTISGDEYGGEGVDAVDRRGVDS